MIQTIIISRKCFNLLCHLEEEKQLFPSLKYIFTNSGVCEIPKSQTYGKWKTPPKKRVWVWISGLFIYAFFYKIQNKF